MTVHRDTDPGDEHTTTLVSVNDGDVVRLRGGSEVRVARQFESYHDAEGDHPGPFIEVGVRDKILLSEVVAVVTPNPHLCILCGGGTTAKDPEKYPYCRVCHYTGAAEESMRGEQLSRFAEAMPDFNVCVEHTGGGCFWLAFYPRQEGRKEMYAATDGEAELPAVDGRALPEGGWGIVVFTPDHAEGSPDEIVLQPEHVVDEDGFATDRYWNEYPAHCLSDQQVIDAIRADWKERSS